jgi:hypothetical protein
MLGVKVTGKAAVSRVMTAGFKSEPVLLAEEHRFEGFDAVADG